LPRSIARTQRGEALALPSEYKCAIVDGPFINTGLLSLHMVDRDLIAHHLYVYHHL